MSAFISAEVGRTYLMTNGRRLLVTHATANAVVVRDENGPDLSIGVGRSFFEREIESVLS